MPRTGLPEYFDSFGEYQRHIEVLVNAGVIEDATKIWWDMRPSDRFPTLETRICDVPTRLDDSIALAAVIQCVCRMLYRLRRDNQRWRQYDRFLIAENRWRAQRYGVDEGLVDFGRGEIVPFDNNLVSKLERCFRPPTNSTTGNPLAIMLLMASAPSGSAVAKTISPTPK